jgi:outer membrane protein OmpA-like peptidoglycan-associated protein
MFVIVTLILLNACASTQLPHKQTPEILGVKQKLSKSDVFPDEYIFCDMQQGAWKCPDVSPKTRIKDNHISHAKSDSVSEQSEAEGFASASDLQKNFNYSDIVGERLGKTHFAFNSYFLTDDSKDILSNLVPKLTGRPMLLLGFTDNIGTELYNDELAFNRANSVKEFLIENGIPESEIHVEGNGVCCYLVPNGTDEQRRINRRVEVYFAD